MKPLVIVNPRSQGGKTGKIAGELVKVLSGRIGDVDLATTERPRHAAELAERAALEGRGIVVVVGGDGTISEASNGLCAARDSVATLPKLGIIGQGTGGDFRKTLGLEHRLDRYCDAIASGKTRSVDAGRFSYHTRAGEERSGYFVNILSLGLGGLADRYVAESGRPLGGSVAYFVAGVRALANIDAAVVRCTVKYKGTTRELEFATRMLAICNGRFFGGGMEVAPMAEPDDGTFHVVSLGAAPKVEFFFTSLSIYRGTHIANPNVAVFPCDAIDITLANPRIRDHFPLDVDGEPLGTLPVSIELVPRALDVFVPG